MYYGGLRPQGAGGTVGGGASQPRLIQLEFGRSGSVSGGVRLRTMGSVSAGNKGHPVAASGNIVAWSMTYISTTSGLTTSIDLDVTDGSNTTTGHTLTGPTIAAGSDRWSNTPTIVTPIAVSFGNRLRVFNAVNLSGTPQSISNVSVTLLLEVS